MKIHPALQKFNPRDFGFKCGLEVHQQLYTEHKLFCRCPAGLYSDEYDAQVKRHMRPTLSELGEYDGTALMEFKTRKEIIYRLNKRTVCTYEMDDNPPFLINRQAVDIAIEIALMLNCSIVGELHVARKQYLDGSIPAGFQRTAIVGVNGWIPYKDRKIDIVQLAIEEDACREVSDIGHQRIYIADRLSMPLIEVVTAPQMFDPKEAYEVGILISNILRTTGKIRRGIGSVRQDVNVSIKDSTRIEIKGVPRLPLIPRLVHYEAYRQHQLLELRDVMQTRGIVEEDFSAERHDLTGKFNPPQAPDSPDDNANDNMITFGIRLRKMAGLLSLPLGPYRTFADDIAGRVKVIACIQQKPVFMHTDEKTPFSLSDSDAEEVRKLSGASNEDAVIVVTGSKEDVNTALNEIEIRCREAITVAVPNETRQVQATGETEFERILPGANRMYPDTDSPPLALSHAEVDKIREILRERPWDREKRLSKLGLSNHLVKAMLVSPRITLFDELISEKKVPAVLAASVLGDLLTHVRRLGGDLKQLTDGSLEELFGLYVEGKFSPEAFRLILEHYARSGETNWKAILAELDILPVLKQELDIILPRIISSIHDKGPEPVEAHTRFVMGEVMKSLRGKTAGKAIMEIVQAA